MYGVSALGAGGVSNPACSSLPSVNSAPERVGKVTDYIKSNQSDRLNEVDHPHCVHSPDHVNIAHAMAS